MTRTQYAPGDSDTRPWGRGKVLDASSNFTLKTIEVDAGQRLSLQFHHHRSEHWVVVQGQGQVTIGDDQFRVAPGSHVHIPRRAPHRLQNIGDQPLMIVEVQYGDRLDEDDIVRIEDDYHR